MWAYRQACGCPASKSGARGAGAEHSDSRGVLLWYTKLSPESVRGSLHDSR